MGTTSTAKNPASNELFKFDGRPSFRLALPQALQHVFAMLVGNITPPILIANALELPETDKILLMQAAMLIGGITTLLQLFPLIINKSIRFGMGLPSVMGVAFAYMPILLTIGQAYGIEAIFGAQLVAGFVSLFLGFFIGKIRKFFPPIVSGTVVLSIGLSLYSTAVTYMAGGSGAGEYFGHPTYWIITLVVLIITLGFSLLAKGTLKVSAMLIGIAVGYILAMTLGAPLNMVSFDSVANSTWIALPKFFNWGLTFNLEAIVLMIIMYVVQAVQTIGDVSSTTMGGFNREATDAELGGAITGQGLCGMLGACIGGLPTDPYSQNVGLIATTKVVAKRVFLMVGIIMLIAGFCPKFGAIMTTIPYPVIGGATITVFAAITMSGIQLVVEQPLNYRNKMIVGIALALGIGVSSVSSSLQHAPEILTNVIGASPIVLAFAVSLILNIIIPVDDTPAED